MPQDKPYRVEVPGLGVVEFPAGTPPQVIEAEIARTLADEKPVGGSGYAADAPGRAGGRFTHGDLKTGGRQLAEGAFDVALGYGTGGALTGPVRRGGIELAKAGARRLPSVVTKFEKVPVEASKILDEFGKPMREATTRTVARQVKMPPEVSPGVLPAVLQAARGHIPGAVVSVLAGGPFAANAMKAGGLALAHGARTPVSRAVSGMASALGIRHALEALFGSDDEE